MTKEKTISLFMFGHKVYLAAYRRVCEDKLLDLRKILKLA